MRRFFFDLNNGDGFKKDDQGLELPTREAINLEIVKILLEVAHDEIGTLDDVSATVTVRDEVGETILLASLTMNNTWTANYDFLSFNEQPTHA